jgi:hypothetical protein
MDWEKRRNPRFECRGVASVQTAAGDPPCPARIVDLSLEGCQLIFQKRQSFPKDKRVELTFEVDHLPFRVRGQVKAIRSDKIAGFQFLELSERARRALEALIQELKENILKRIAELKAHEEWLKAHGQVDSEDSAGQGYEPEADAIEWSDETGLQRGRSDFF